MADKEVAMRKLTQLEGLLKELEMFLGESFDLFLKDIILIRATERNFQLIVDIASDVNGEILTERGNAVSDTYKQTFTQLAKEKILAYDLAEQLVQGAQIRNILVHEYDFEEDYEKFYMTAKKLIPIFHEYIKIMYNYMRDKK